VLLKSGVAPRNPTFLREEGPIFQWRPLAQSDPGNAGRQRDLAISYERLADLYRQSKDRGKALAALRQGKAIMDRLVKLSPDNAKWKRDLAWFDQQIAALTE
jgi:hypothetical protein